jgi:hypothetical protein
VKQAMTTVSANHGQVRSGSADSTSATDEFSDRVTLSQHGRVTSAPFQRPDPHGTYGM